MNIIQNFNKISGAARMIQNLVFSGIREFNSNPFGFQTQNNIFGRLVVSGNKALDLFLFDKNIPSFSIDAILLLSKDFIQKKIIPKNTPSIQESILANSIQNFFQSNPPESILEEIGDHFSNLFNQQIDYRKLTDPYANMIYVVQMDGIMNAMQRNICKDQFVTKIPCYSCQVIYKVERSIVDGKFVWMIIFTLQIFSALSFMGPVVEGNPINVDFFRIRIANDFLQVQDFLNRLAIEISPQLFVILPTHTLNFTIDINSIPDEERRNINLENYQNFISLPMTKYSCTVINFLYPSFNNYAFDLQYSQLKNSPQALNRVEESTYNELFKDGNNLSKTEINNYVRAQTDVNNPLIFQEYERKFMEKKLKNVGIINNLNTIVLKNDNKNKNINNSKLKNARSLCEKYFATNISINQLKNNRNNGVKSKYNRESRDNYYGKPIYDMFRLTDAISLLNLQQNTKKYAETIFKFTTFGYIRFFMDNYEQFAEMPASVCLDDVDVGQTYFLSMPLEQGGKYSVSRNGMDQDGYLIVIRPQNVYANVREVDMGDNKKIDFYNFKVKLEGKIGSYQKVELVDGTSYLDQIKILLFSEIVSI